jgi:hypothetical protein
MDVALKVVERASERLPGLLSQNDALAVRFS